MLSSYSRNVDQRPSLFVCVAHVCEAALELILHDTSFAIALPEASSTMRALSSARCTGVRLYILRIKIGTNQRALGELSHC